ncbi:MAG: hypothetical protein AAF492_05525, partial [Verrucomicrobiota bacterium]
AFGGDEDELTQTVSVMGTASYFSPEPSLVVNDTTLEWPGALYERCLLHAMTALNHIALNKWDGASVAARRILKDLNPDFRKKYPDDAFSRYLAGFCLDVEGDPDNASIQYRKASDLVSRVDIDPQTGRMAFSGGEGPPQDRAEHELLCFVLLGRAPKGSVRTSDRFIGDPLYYAEIFDGDTRLGRSYTLTDTRALAAATEKIDAKVKAARAAARIAIKESLAEAAAKESKSDEVGDLVRLVLIGMLEHPDFRRWETLPRWLQVIRVPCPPDLQNCRLVIRNSHGGKVKNTKLVNPITRHDSTFVTFYRDATVF